MPEPTKPAPEASADPNARPLPPHLGLLSGLLMGTADAIPGVSGGTIALIIGIYERFIAALAAVLRAPLALRNPDVRAALWRALRLLVPLGVGVLAAYYMATKILVGPEDEPGILVRTDTAPIAYAFLFGLVLVSIREPWRRMAIRPGASHLAIAAVTAAAAAVFVGLPHQGGEPALIALLFGGAAAISVMLLPGISGSLLLVILGQYAVVANAVHDRETAVLAIFALGIVLGTVSFVPFLRYLLRTKHDLTMAALTGLLAGSLRALWPWKEGYEPKESMANVGIGENVIAAIGAATAGGLAVWLLSRIERRMSPTTGSGRSGNTSPGEAASHER